MAQESASLKLWIDFTVYLFSILSSCMKSRDCRTITRTRKGGKLSDLSYDILRIDQVHGLLIQAIRSLWFEYAIVFYDRVDFFCHFYQSIHKWCHLCTRQPDYCPRSPRSLFNFKRCKVSLPQLRYLIVVRWNSI